jgi:hypothetical protein
MGLQPMEENKQRGFRQYKQRGFRQMKEGKKT